MSYVRHILVFTNAQSLSVFYFTSSHLWVKKEIEMLTTTLLLFVIVIVRINAK